MELTDKVILVISSEEWGKIFISKHHYAATLAQLGNTVYFLNPVSNKLKIGEIQIKTSSINKNLSVITYRPFFPWLIKFHAKWLFNILIKFQLRKISQKIKTRIDIVWDFNCSFLYHNLSVLKAGINIFHPVDKISLDAVNKKADIVFSVSSLILKDYKVPNIPKFLINHGVSKRFEEVACCPPIINIYDNRKIKACYIGNLLIPSLNRDLVEQVITGNPGIEFSFIGPYSTKQNNIYSDFNTEDEKFIHALKSKSNVKLQGILSTDEIASQINKFDLFFICYKNSKHYRCDNSHKVLEYLSTGKVVVSTPISFYQNSDLLQMSKGEDDFNILFSEVISNLKFFNSEEMMNKRKAFAKSNTYEKHIKKIETLINNYVLNQQMESNP